MISVKLDSEVTILVSCYLLLDVLLSVEVEIIITLQPFLAQELPLERLLCSFLLHYQVQTVRQWEIQHVKANSLDK